MSPRAPEQHTDSPDLTTIDRDAIALELVSFIRDYLLLPEVKDRPDIVKDNKEFNELLVNLSGLREVLFSFSKGDLFKDVKLSGFLAGCIKQLQAHLRHIMWQTDQIAAGDFTQKVDFLGPVSEAFNKMGSRIAQLVGELQEKEAVLLRLTEDLRQEIEAGKQKELQLEREQERWQLAFACSMDGVWDMDLIAGTTYCSPRFLQILHLSQSTGSHTFDWEEHLHPDDADVRDIIHAVLCGAEEPDHLLEHRFLCGDGVYRWMGTRCMLIRDKDGTPIRMIGVTEDAQDRHMREAALSLQATHDRLTGLPNRYLYEDRLRQYAAMARRHNSAFVLLVLDLDGFKEINDTLGHFVGDCVLKKIAERLLLHLRETDTVSRFGGDEFLILLPCELGQEHRVAQRAVNTILDCFKEKIEIESHFISVALSAGGACYPVDTTDLEELFCLADSALYTAKRNGKRQLKMWDSSLVKEPN